MQRWDRVVTWNGTYGIVTRENKSLQTHCVLCLDGKEREVSHVKETEMDNEKEETLANNRAIVRHRSLVDFTYYYK